MGRKLPTYDEEPKKGLPQRGCCWGQERNHPLTPAVQRQRHQHTGEDDRLWVTRAALKSSAQRKGLGCYFIAAPLTSHHKHKFKQKPKTLGCYSRKERE